MATVYPVTGNGCKGSRVNADGDTESWVKLKCLKNDDETYTCAEWRYFYVNCPKCNVQCNSTSGAYVAAVTVCAQNLW